MLGRQPLRRSAAILALVIAGGSNIATLAVAQVSPEESAKLLEPAAGLEAKLWAAEPMVVNPTTMDIDSRGRVWITEGLNYRLTRGGNRQFQRIDDADKIKILTDTDGDGRADKMTVFADKVFPVPMGLAVEERWSKEGRYLGARVFVGNSPDILVLEDTDGDDKADKRYPLLTGFGGIDSDHGVHGMTLGIDGKLYFTHGDGCCSVQQDKSERAQNFDVVDKSGRRVSSDQLANTLRVNRDGTQFEILADRQRNNYETCLNSFGNVFSSDNDDDGNRGSRVIWVMEGGQYGYRTPGSSRHWGEDTPGPVPKLVGTGNGSPCGLMVYEGTLLPEEYRNSLYEAEAGPRVINYFPLSRHGAAFRTVHKVMLSSKDPWFRPVDVTAAPDGSVFVADWYDAGVGGHAFRDQTTGRIYRITPKGSNPGRAIVDFSTIPGLIDALKSPNTATRDVARRLLIERKDEAHEALRELGMKSDNPAYRARAAWVLFGTFGEAVGLYAIADKDPAIRELGVRMLGRDVATNGKVEGGKPAARPAESNLDALIALADDADAGVRRELILALRNIETEKVGDALRKLTAAWDGQDRWYLEALGLALQGREPAFVASLFDGKLFGAMDLDSTRDDGTVALPPYFPADRNEAYIQAGTPDGKANAVSKTLGLAWRLRRGEALELIAKILPELRAPELRQAADDVLVQMNGKEAAVMIAEMVAKASDSSRKNALLATLNRKFGGEWRDARRDPRVIAAIESALADPALRIQGIALAGNSAENRYEKQLMGFARDEAADEAVRVAAVEAVAKLGLDGAGALVEGLIAATKGKGSTPAAQAAVRSLLSIAGKGESDLRAILTDSAYPLGVRRDALRALAAAKGGPNNLVVLAESGKLPSDLRTEATTIVHRSPSRPLRDRAEKVLPLPTMANGRKLLSLFDILRRDGDASKGAEVFHRTGANACATCHRAQGRGNWIGPDLSTIGTKYGKPELLQSIINPNEAIGYNFRSVILALDDGRVVTGLPVEESAGRIVIKTAGGERVTVDPAKVEERKFSEISLMPEGLAQTLSDDELVDLLAFLKGLDQPVSIVGAYRASAPVASTAERPTTFDRRVTADAESRIDLAGPAGGSKETVAYLSTPISSPEPLAAKLVIDTDAAVKAWLNGKEVALASPDGKLPKMAPIELSAGANELVIGVPGGSKGGLVTTIVAKKPLEFR
ncbi:MAG: c-type cytochrome [Isosphaeraceae bacterium]|nr:c-type cytochrome [Isosphaeraceae bacterium]